MQEKLEALFAIAKQPTFATADDTKGLLKPVLALAAKMQSQVGEHRGALFEIETTPETAQHRDRCEKLHQTLDTIERHAKAIVTASRELNTSMAQYERYAAEIEAQIADIDAKAAALAAATTNESGSASAG